LVSAPYSRIQKETNTENISYKVKGREDHTIQDEVQSRASLTQVSNAFNACEKNRVSIHQCRQKYEEEKILVSTGI